MAPRVSANVELKMTPRESLLSALRSRKLPALAALIERTPEDRCDFSAINSELQTAFAEAYDTGAIEAGEMAEG